MQKPTFWKDGYGSLRVGWTFLFGFAGVLAACLALGVVCSTAAFYIQKQGCYDKAHGYGLNNVSYSFWANTCFVDSPSGQRVNIDSLRVNAKGQIIYLEGHLK
jgi:hypothetical protein